MPAKAVIAMAYIFVGIYGLTWVSGTIHSNLAPSGDHAWLLTRQKKKAPAAWIYCSEVFPLKYRAKGVGVSAATNWMCVKPPSLPANQSSYPHRHWSHGHFAHCSFRLSFNLALAFFVPPAFTNIDWKTYMIFGTFCAVMFFHVFLTYPETCRKSLEEIDVVFEGDVRPWRSSTFGGTFQDRVEEEARRRSGVGGAAAGTDDLRNGHGDVEKGTTAMPPARDSGVGKEEHSHHETV